LNGGDLMVRVNGKETDICGISVADYLKTTSYDLRFIALEINEKIVPKSQYEETIIEDGDRIEIVSFVGGG